MSESQRPLIERVEPLLQMLLRLAPQMLDFDALSRTWTVQAFGAKHALNGGPQDALRLRAAAVAHAAETGLQLYPQLEIGELLRVLSLKLSDQRRRNDDAAGDDGDERLVTFTARVRASNDASAINRALAALALEPGVSNFTDTDAAICIEDCDEDGEPRSISARHYDPDEIALLLTALPNLA